MTKPASELIALADAGTRHADGLSAKLEIPNWRPSRSHIEQARNSIRKLEMALRTAANQSASERAGVDAQSATYKAAWDAFAEATMQPETSTFDCLKRAVDAALATPPAQPAPAGGVQAWAAWHPVHGFGKLPNACADIDDAIEDAKCQTILDDSPDWKAVRVEIRRV